MIRVRTKSIELMTTEITAWEVELKSKEDEAVGPTEVLETTKKQDEPKTTTTETAATSSITATNTSIASANNTPKKQKLVHFNKS